MMLLGRKVHAYTIGYSAEGCAFNFLWSFTAAPTAGSLILLRSARQLFRDMFGIDVIQACRDSEQQ
jgi:hypothetical protein